MRKPIKLYVQHSSDYKATDEKGRTWYRVPVGEGWERGVYRGLRALSRCASEVRVVVQETQAAAPERLLWTNPPVDPAQALHVRFTATTQAASVAVYVHGKMVRHFSGRISASSSHAADVVALLAALKVTRKPMVVVVPPHLAHSIRYLPHWANHGWLSVSGKQLGMEPYWKAIWAHLTRGNIAIVVSK